MAFEHDFRVLARKNYQQLLSRYPAQVARILAIEQATAVALDAHFRHTDPHSQYIQPLELVSAVTATVQHAIAALTPASIGAAPAAHTHPSPLSFAVLSGAAKPTTRADGSALVAGDRWWSTADNMWFFWRSGLSVWMSEVQHTAPNLGTNSGILPIKASGLDIYIEEYAIAGRTGLINSSIANIQITLERCSATADTTIASLNTGAIAANTRFSLSTTLNLLLDVSALNLTSLRTVTNTLLNASALVSSVAQITYRWVKP